MNYLVLLLIREATKEVAALQNQVKGDTAQLVSKAVAILEQMEQALVKEWSK